MKFISVGEKMSWTNEIGGSCRNNGCMSKDGSKGDHVGYFNNRSICQLKSDLNMKRNRGEVKCSNSVCGNN